MMNWLIIEKLNGTSKTHKNLSVGIARIEIPPRRRFLFYHVRHLIFFFTKTNINAFRTMYPANLVDKRSFVRIRY